MAAIVVMPVIRAHLAIVPPVLANRYRGNKRFRKWAMQAASPVSNCCLVQNTLRK